MLKLAPNFHYVVWLTITIKYHSIRCQEIVKVQEAVGYFELGFHVGQERITNDSIADIYPFKEESNVI